ncbi:retrovirus-related pol polyprotein from transposon TNT 1-94 [Tanacetum coccineum]
MDSGGSFHMTPRRDFLFDFKEFNGGTVLLGDNRACVIMGIGKVRVQMKDGSRFVLENVPESGEASVGIQEKESLAQVNFLRYKNEAFSKFKEWKQLVENQTSRKLKKLRTDNGLKFCNQKFNNLCKENWITRHLTVAGTPQQNGLAERMNMMLLNKVSIYIIGEEDTYRFMVRTSGELRDVKDIWLRCLFTRESREAQA